MIQRAAYEKEIKEQDAMDSDEDELGVFEGDELPSRTEGKQDIKGKGKPKETTPPAVIDEDTHISLNKRRRPVVDPFAGYGDDIASRNRPTAKKSLEDSPQANHQTSSNLDPKTSTEIQTSSNGKKRSKSEKKSKKRMKDSQRLHR